MKIFKYIIIIIATIGLLFAMTSCGDGDEIARTLIVDESAVLLGQAAQERAVNVTVDAGVSFTAVWKGESWGQVVANVDEGVVIIKTTANTTVKPRKASVIVTLDGGYRNSVINITQNGDTPFLSVVPDRVSFDFVGGDFIVEVASNVDWSVKSDVEWLKAESFNTAGRIILKAEENKNTFERSTTMTVTAGVSSKEVSVYQAAEPEFILPFLSSPGDTYEDLLAFEKERYSVVIGSDAYTKSKLMPLITYLEINTPFKVSLIDIQINEKVMPDFFGDAVTKGRSHDLMLNTGYEYLFRAGESEFYWCDRGVGAPYHYLVNVDKSVGYVKYDAVTTKPDPVDMPTLDVMPYKPAEVAWGSHKDEAKIFEIRAGATMERDVPSVLDFTTPEDRLYRQRQYVYRTADDDLSMMSYVLVESELARIYLLSPVGGKYMINPRFETLLANEGFTYLKKDGGYPIYENTAKELEVKIWIVNISGSTASHGAITYLHVPAVTPTGPSKFGSARLAPYVGPLKNID